MTRSSRQGKWAWRQRLGISQCPERYRPRLVYWHTRHVLHSVRLLRVRLYSRTNLLTGLFSPRPRTSLGTRLCYSMSNEWWTLNCYHDNQVNSWAAPALILGGVAVTSVRANAVFMSVGCTANIQDWGVVPASVSEGKANCKVFVVRYLHAWHLLAHLSHQLVRAPPT